MRRKLPRISVFVMIIAFYGIIRPAVQAGQPDLQAYVPEDPPFLSADKGWADSLMKQLSLEEKIAQMIMVYGYSNMGPVHEKAVIRQVRRQKIGGILFFQGEAREQVRLTRLYQEASSVPLLIAMDGETGPGMRLENSLSYPSMMSLGSISDDSLIFRMGQDMGEQFRRLGVHMNLAPVADVNSNPRNPVIGSRSFGEDPAQVASKVKALVKGLQDRHVLVAAKHFPGHGDTDMDSHRTLPELPFGRERLDSVELRPFREAIHEGLTGIMVAHLQVPALDGREDRAVSLSREAVTGLLKEEMGFRGLVITDALNMKGLSEHFEPGEREVQAVLAGNDILLMPADPGKTIKAIKKAVRKGQIDEAQIEASCRKILQAKYWARAPESLPENNASLLEDLKKDAYLMHLRELAEHSLVLAENSKGILPLDHLESMKLATLTLSKGGEASGLKRTESYLEGGAHFRMPLEPGPALSRSMLNELRPYNTIIVNLYCSSRRASGKYGIPDATLHFLEQLDPSARLVLNVAGSPYSLGRLRSPELFDAIILSHYPDSLYQDLALQAIFGGASFSGRMPVTAGIFPSGRGFFSGVPIRLGYANPRDAGLHPDTLELINEIIRKAMSEKAIPGCQVLVARDGTVVLHRTWGHHSYQRKQKTRPDDIYDLASVTKMASATTAMMRLRDQGQFHEDSLLSSLPTVPDSSNKAGLLLGDILAHQSGMIPWIPYYYETLEALDTSQTLISSTFRWTHPLKIGDGTYFNRNVKYLDSAYQDHYAANYNLEVADGLYLRSDWQDTIFKRIYDSELVEAKYRYSGLFFYMFTQIIEAVTDTALYPYVWYNFYEPLGARTLGYKPLERFPEKRIVPTENDIYFRRQLLHGHVHDQGAAMLNGISGNAGLFGAANDLAKLMQMYLNGGSYGGRRYLSRESLERYTARYNTRDGDQNRRGLGFDKPVTWEEDAGPACGLASSSSFGHTGFTGTMAWADPEYDLIYIFLSNRVHPDMGNNKLIDLHVRTEVQEVIYRSIRD